MACSFSQCKCRTHSEQDSAVAWLGFHGSAHVTRRDLWLACQGRAALVAIWVTRIVYTYCGGNIQNYEVVEMAQPDNNNTLSSAFKTFFEREKLTGDNFNDWYHSLRIVLRVAGTYDYLFKPCPEEPPEDAAENVKAA
ncbi:hypothetical protein Tco_0836209 [Tanacetum coccineum]